MTVRQKAAQTLLVTVTGASLQADTQAFIAAGPPGGLLLTAENVGGPEQLRALTAALQRAAKAVEPQLGLFVAVGDEDGVTQLITTGTSPAPAARQLAEQSSPLDAARFTGQTATALLDLGINMDLAPVADVVEDPASYLYDRSYSGDPIVVGDFVKAVTSTLEQKGLISVVKHFPGEGGASADPHEQAAISDVSAGQFANVHLRPFKVALAAGAEGVLVSEVTFNAYDTEEPAAVSPSIVQDVLRDGLRFTGLVIADDIQMPAAAGPDVDPGAPRAPGQTAEIAVQALTAGCDAVICSGTPVEQTAVLDAIVAAVGSGRLPERRLNDAVLHMLAIKVRHNLVYR